jgi:pimeloyl-ACP methyl ester carboxylesterase
MTSNARQLLQHGTASRPIAYRLRAGAAPTIVFLPGYASDMDGAKAVAIDAFAGERGVGCLRLDYSGTGSSPGSFAEGTLARWIDDAASALDQLTDGPLILVGSSMGGWIALHLALSRPERVRALVGVAAAPDFTDWGFGAQARQMLQRDGRLGQPNPDGSATPHLITQAFWESGQQLRLLTGDIDVLCPVRLVHGDADRDVPLETSLRTMNALRSADVQLSVIKGGGHRLSEPREMAAILAAIAGLLEPLP